MNEIPMSIQYPLGLLLMGVAGYIFGWLNTRDKSQKKSKQSD